MSFILDALKKSESERQRQSGPALFEVKVAPPRSRLAVWGAVIGALLVINFVVVGWVLWRGSGTRAATPAAPVTSGTVPASPAATPVEARAEARPEPRAEARAVASTPSTPSAPSAAGAPATAPAATATNAVGAPAPGGANVVAAATVPPVSASGAAPAGENPDDLAPAVEPRGASASQPVNGIIRATESGLPTYQDAAAEPGADLPNLKLDLHVYDAQPEQRFVFLEADAHMLKLREGETSPQGVRVEHITQDGVILSYRGKEFVLQH